MAAEESTKESHVILRSIKREMILARLKKPVVTENKNLQRGTKDLMAAIQAGIKRGIEDIEDVDNRRINERLRRR